MPGSTETYPIVGVQTGHGPKPNQVPLRIEVDDFFNDPDRAIQRDLLYLSLAKFQDMPYKEKLSYFQIAGIHGLPYTTWDDPSKPDGTPHPIYCEHGTVLFGTWHRPYMALFEQRLYEIMVNEIIPGYPESARELLKKEADQFRLPYWDWATKKPRTKDGKDVLVYDLPLIVKAETVQVTNSTGGLETIKNPFYNFEAKDEMGRYGITELPASRDAGAPTIPFDQVTTTSRCPPDPINGNAADLAAFLSGHGVENNMQSAKNITEANWGIKREKDNTISDADWDVKVQEVNAWSLQDAVYRILTPGYFETYTQFVTTVEAEALGDPKFYLSLEGIHGNVHAWTGGNFGHMGHIPVAGFDPIFYLHHCNVDRLLAIWQKINPKKWFEKFELRDPFHPEIDIRTLTPTTPLEPFHSDNAGTFYTSETASNHLDFGYSYPELQQWNFDTEEEYIADINKQVEKLYAPDPTTLLKLAHHDAVVNVSFEKFALSGLPFTVNVLLKGELIGKVENFSFVPENPQDGSIACENCRQQREHSVRITGQVFATGALVKAAEDPANVELKVLDRESIAAYLKEHLSWNATLWTGKVVEIPSLRVFPAIGRRNVNRLSDSGSNGPVVMKPGVSRRRKQFLKRGVIDLPSITSEVILTTKASRDENGTIQVHDNRDPNKVYQLELAGWGSYEAI